MIIAAAQFPISKIRTENIARALGMVQLAAKNGANLVVLPELFEFQYFPILPPNANKQRALEIFSLASSAQRHPYLPEFLVLAKKKNIAIVFSFFEKWQGKYYNSSLLISAEGKTSRVYRKMHLPSGSLYEENLYFTSGGKLLVVPLKNKPFIKSNFLYKSTNTKTYLVGEMQGGKLGKTGVPIFKSGLPLLNKEQANQWQKKNIHLKAVWQVGMGICWDQWFSMHAGAMANSGANLLAYPTAIGSELDSPGFHSAGHWQTVMQGHAAANTVVVVAANRVGTELAQTVDASGRKKTVRIKFYGSSFIAGPNGKVLAKMGNKEGLALACISLEELVHYSESWGIKKQSKALWHAARFKNLK